MKDKFLSDAIYRVAWSYILLHLSFKIGPVDVLPDWFAYILIYQAIGTIQEEEPTAALLKPLAAILVVLSVAHIFIGEIPVISWIEIIISLYFHFQFLTNLANIAVTYDCDEDKKLYNLRTARTILMTIFALPVPWDNFQFATIVLLILNLIVVIWICSVLFSFRRSLQMIGK